MVLAVLVFGLLRSHAEIPRTLHQLGAGTDSDADAPPASRPVQVARSSSTGFDVVGTTVADEVLRNGVVGARQGTLLAFLTSGCFTCAGFWDSFRTGPRLTVPGGARLVVVTKGPKEESGSRIRELSPADVPVVMSTAAWEDYEVPVAPTSSTSTGRRAKSRTVPGKAGAQFFFSIGDRAFSMFIVIGNYSNRARLVPVVNSVVETLQIEA